MVIQGNSLIISSGGEVFAASKSCDINVQVKTIDTASPTNGQWEESIIGRKSWQVTTNHLMLSKTYIHNQLSACGSSHPNHKQAYVKVDGAVNTANLQARGLSVTVYSYSSGAFTLEGTSNFDTYGSIQDRTNFIYMLQGITGGKFVFITSYDAYTMTADMRTAVLGIFTNLTTADIPLADAQRYAFALVGKKGGVGICRTAMSEDAQTAVNLYIGQSGYVCTDTMLKNMVNTVGTTLNLKMQVDGFALDVLRGTAHCTTFRSTGTLGNLLQGSFSFKGSGPLE